MWYVCIWYHYETRQIIYTNIFCLQLFNLLDFDNVYGKLFFFFTSIYLLWAYITNLFAFEFGHDSLKCISILCVDVYLKSNWRDAIQVLEHKLYPRLDLKLRNLSTAILWYGQSVLRSTRQAQQSLVEVHNSLLLTVRVFVTMEIKQMFETIFEKRVPQLYRRVFHRLLYHTVE